MVYDSYQPRLFALVPPGSRVLDVGCGTGRMGHLLRSQKGCSVVGVEVEKDSVAQASTVYDRVIQADLDAVGQLDLPEDSFDCVILGDVLEHIKDPPRLLSLAARHLAPGGFLLVSTPNVAHWRTRLGLLAGRFNYTERGILDANHLRFFTFSTLSRTLQEAGFRIEAMEGYGWWWSNLWRGPLASAIVAKAVKLARGEAAGP